MHNGLPPLRWLFPPADNEAQAPAQDAARTDLARAAADIRAQAWRVTKIVWQAFCAALIPISLRDLPAALQRFSLHLGRSKDNVNRPRQIDAFLAGLAHGFG